MQLIGLGNSVIIFHSQMTLIRLLTFLLRSLIVTFTVLLFCIYLFLLYLVFALLWLSLHSKILILLWPQFPLALLQPQMEMSLFITQLYYSRTDWDCLCIQLKAIPWKDIFNFGICAAPTEFCLCIQVGTDV